MVSGRVGNSPFLSFARSLKSFNLKSDRERIAPVAHNKRATMSDSLLRSFAPKIEKPLSEFPTLVPGQRAKISRCITFYSDIYCRMMNCFSFFHFNSAQLRV